jgi:hypothetical protein
MGYYTLLLASTCSNLQWIRYIIYLHSHKQNMNIVEIKQQNKNKNVAHIFSILLVFFNTFCLRFVSSTLCCPCPCIVYYCLPFRSSLTFINTGKLHNQSNLIEILCLGICFHIVTDHHAKQP